MKKSELENILKEVEVELADFVKAQSDVLRKASEEGGEGEESAGEGEGGPGPDASATAPAPAGPEDASAGAPEGEGSAPVEGAPAEGAPADPAAGGDAEQVDPAQLEQEYSQMPPEMLKAHFLACKAAVEKLMGAGAGPDAGGAPPAGPEGSPAGAPPAPAGAPAGAPPAGPPPAMKAEKPMAQPSGSVKGTGTIKANGENDMGKSENFAAIQAQLEALTKAVTLIVERPVRKAMTGNEFTAQPEAKPMSKAEVTAILNEKTSDPKLSKADRDLVNAFYDGAVKIDKIAHLLKKV